MGKRSPLKMSEFKFEGAHNSEVFITSSKGKLGILVRGAPELWPCGGKYYRKDSYNETFDMLLAVASAMLKEAITEEDDVLVYAHDNGVDPAGDSSSGASSTFCQGEENAWQLVNLIFGHSQKVDDYVAIKSTMTEGFSVIGKQKDGTPWDEESLCRVFEIKI